MPPRAPRIHPQQALAVYAEPLAAGRRVVVFGDPASGLMERFDELGAETVVLLTPDDDLDELRGARFDLAIVADLALFPDPVPLLACVRRLLGDTGAALVVAPNREPGAAGPGSLDYYGLFDLVAHEFADVRMIAQLPFHGVALAEVGDEGDSPAVSVDTQLADPDRSPEAFVALASQRGTSLDPYAIVELPAPEPPAPDTEELDELRALLDETRGQLDATRGELQQSRAQLQERTEALLALRAQASRATELERELAIRGRQLGELSSEVEEMRSAAEAGRIAAAQVEELARRADRAEKARAQAEPELARLAEAHAAELLVFEETLRERAQAVRLLEAEVARREHIVRELVGALDEHMTGHAHEGHPAPVAPPGVAQEGPSPTEAALVAENALLQQRLDALALELARREGEAHASAWTIAELERKLAQAATPVSAPIAGTDAGPRLAAALDELDALRRALTQEHEARIRAESGEDLVRAREELARQSVLLEQLAQRLAALDAPDASAVRNEELR